MKRMSVTFAFLIGMVVILWFFGMTLFQQARAFVGDLAAALFGAL